MKKKEPKTIRGLMPDGYIKLILAEAKKSKVQLFASNISNMVANEYIKWKHWGIVEKVALEVNPKAYRERIEYIESLQAKSIS